MGIASDLRQSVLQAAMQGKLTTQKAEDGDARDLLLAIREEKEKLIKEKKIKKGKPLAPITDEEIPFDIPDNWVWVRLSDICKTIVDCPHSTPKYYQEDTGYAGIDTNCINANGDITKLRYVDKQTYYQRIKRLEPLENDIVLTREGSIGRAAILPKNKKICLGQRVMLLRLSSFADVRLFRHFLMSYATLVKLTEKQKGLGAKHINVSDVCKLVFPLPPLPEQQRIVARVEALMKEIDELEQTEKELEAIKAAFPCDMKASLLQAAMEGKLTTQKAEDGDAKDLLLAIRKEKEKLVKEKKGKREKPLAPITDEEIPFDIPENWVWCRLNDITVKEIRRGKSPKYSDVQSNTLSFAQKCNTKYDGIQMSLAKYLDESTLKRYTEEDAIIDGDTIINSTGHGTLGRVGFFTDSNNPNHLTIYPDSHVTVVRPSRNCDSRFIHLYIKTQQSWFETKGEGSTNQTELKPAVIKSIVIPLPPLPEQRRIVEKLDQLLPLCDSLSEH